MLFTTLLSAAALVGVSLAQTPQGFTPSVNTKLDVIFNSTVVKKPGELLTKALTASQPQIAIANASATETFMFVMLDLDVPGQGSNATRRTLLHAMVTDFKATTQQVLSPSVTNGKLLVSSQKGPATYIGPGPPATDTIPHRYVQLLFQQPANLNVKATDFANNQARFSFEINAFMKTNGIKAPVAGNFFTVDGKASGGAGGAGATGSRSASAGLPKSTLQPFTGAVGRTGVSVGLAGLVGGLALLGL
ncbi:phosphatidylethanolamine-binding protein [Clohesyomyces aquaticus]|uniref:Phosphatidylethanolamine-binding protein n=1 Tax=Clohesyomyces aquaticus TaxID=1231657 RepID=A0A1Y1YG91_9PLEO|nr:phosphatidylethanolamine-binding protein [Clohesyomyces aquaticus]